MARPKPVVLAILDGWGHSESADHNAIMAARTPNWDALLAQYPHGLLNASELHVGLPEGQMGNSEVGHMNIGSGRVVMQELPRIDTAIADGSLAENPELVEFIHKLKAGTGICHLMGLLSPGGVHSHQDHMAALANILAAHGIKVRLHAFLDGRDTPPQSALEYIAAFRESIKDPESIVFATVCGRFFAMDRDKRWDRVEAAYQAMIGQGGDRISDIRNAVAQAYEKTGKGDEFVPPSVLGDFEGMRDGDGLLMANFRADRAREILTALLDEHFRGFDRKQTMQFSAALGMVEYSGELAKFMPAIFPPEPLHDILGELVSRAGLTQLRIAETEKYAHVTFFFNGGREQEFPGEQRILVPSPKVATYDLKPEMSAPEVTDKLVAAIDSDQFDFIVVNYANTDMVGHSGDMQATVRAVEAVDACLGRLSQAVLAKGGALLVTADHGNAEQLFDPNTDQAHTAHTLNLVPLVIAAAAFKGKRRGLPEGRLGDVAPTVLSLLGLPQPPAMTGTSLLADHVA